MSSKSLHENDMITSRRRVLEPLLWVFGLSTIAFCLLAVAVMSGTTAGFDTATLEWINTHASPFFDTFFVAISNLGDVIFVIFVGLLLLAYLLYTKQYHKALFVVLGIGLSALFNVILKGIFERTRPDLWEWLAIETSYSFPSGHATASMALALCCVAILWRTKWRTVTITSASAYVLLIGFSRLYLGVHYPTDILGGWLLSLATVSLVALIIYFVTHPRSLSAGKSV